MWRDVEDRTLPTGVVKVDAAVTRVVFGAKTVRAWGLTRYKTISPKRNDSPDIVAFQLYEGDGGTRSLHKRGKADTRVVSCAGMLRGIGVDPGRYRAHHKSGWILVDFRLGKVDQFALRRKK